MQESSPSNLQRLTEVVDTQYITSQESDADLLRKYWRMLVKRCRLVVSVFLAVFGLGVYFSLPATPLYTASAMLRIEPQIPAVTGMGQVMTTETMGSEEYYRTEFELLKSRPVAARVISQLKLESNEAFNADIRSSNLFAGLRSGFAWLVGRCLAFARSLADLVRSPSPPEGVSPPKREFELDVPPWLIGRYLGFLQVQPVERTRLVKVVFSTPDPQLSQDLANAHIEAFIRTNLETRFELTGEARQFLEAKLSDIRAKLAQAEAVLQRFRKKHDVVSLEGGENIAERRMVDLNNRLTEARTKRIELESLYQMVKGKNSQYLSQVIGNALIQGLKANLAGLEIERARLSATFTPDHPRIQELNKQMSEQRRHLNLEIENAVRGIESEYTAARLREEALQAETERQQQMALNLKDLGAQYILLQQDVNSTRSLYEGVLKRSKETNVSNDVAVSNIQIAERAEVPPFPASPNTQRDLMLAAACGLFLGVGLAPFLGYIDSTVGTPEDVWRAISVPTLGVVPHLDSLPHWAREQGQLLKPSSFSLLGYFRSTPDHTFSQALIMSHHPFSIMAESYRIIRTALLLSQAERPLEVVLFTSARPGEGKTISTLNLATTLAQSGRTVVVVDADLRNGSCHTYLRRPNRSGLSDILSGSLLLDEAIQETAVARLSFLPRGKLPLNPADLLGSPMMQIVLQGLRRRFDSVLIDSPPALAVPDAAILSQFCDGVALVVRGQRSSAETMRLVMERLQAVHARILGVVLNGVDIRDPDYVDYRHYYKSCYSAVYRDANQLEHSEGVGKRQE